MSSTEVLGEAWTLYRRHWTHLVPIALVVFLLLALFSLALAALLGWLGLIAAGFVALAGTFWLQGALVVAVEDIRDGRADLSIRETLSRVMPRINTLGLGGVIASVAITIGLLLLVVPGLVLLTWWLVFVPVIMLEGRGTFEAFGRSRELVRGNGWNAFGLILLVVLVIVVVGIALEIVTAPLGDTTGRYVSDVVSNTLTAPFVALALTLAYYRLRGTSEAPAAAADAAA